MQRYAVTMVDGSVWDLSAPDVDGAAERACTSSVMWGTGCRVAQIVQTREQWIESERARFVRDMAELGAVVVGAVRL